MTGDRLLAGCLCRKLSKIYFGLLIPVLTELLRYSKLLHGRLLITGCLIKATKLIMNTAILISVAGQPQLVFRNGFRDTVGFRIYLAAQDM